MKIRRVHIKNFRSIKGQEITCEDQTIFIGGNGAGKSTILKAIQLFFDLKFKPTKDDYFAHNQVDPIEITIVFSSFNETEKKDFEARIHNDEMTVTRAFGGKGDEDGNFHGLIRGCPDFQQVRAASKPGDKKVAYARLIENGHDLPPWKNQGAADEALAEWEAKNPEKCDFVKDGGQFFGFKSVGGGKLQKAANFIMIEAVRDVSEDASDQKNSAIGQLMDLIVRSAMAQNQKIVNYKDEVNKKYAELTSPESFPQLGSLQDSLTKSLNTYYQDVGVKLEWGETPGVAMPPPQAAIKFREDSFEYPVTKAGNGVQRAFVISLLHQLLVAKSNSDDAKEESSPDEDDTEHQVPDANLLEKLPSVILAIEEPELYQHPTKQWHFAQVLRKLSSGALKNTFGDVQVLFCTHSPIFVNLSDFHNTRITKKETLDGTNVKQTIFQDASISNVGRMIEKVQGWDDGVCNYESTKAHLHIFGTELSEGFFSKGVVLVEGVSDKVALETVAELKGRSFVESNISVLPVNGKNNMDRPWIVFNELEIPAFPVWDADSNCRPDDKETNIKTNKALQRMIRVEDEEIVEFPNGIYSQFACFHRELGEQMKEDFGDQDYNDANSDALSQFGLTSKKGRKNPYVIRFIIQNLYSKGKSSETLEAIVDQVFNYILRKNDQEKEHQKAA